MLKSLLINSNPRSQRALQRVEHLAATLGMSKSQAAVWLIDHAPEPLATKLEKASK